MDSSQSVLSIIFLNTAKYVCLLFLLLLKTEDDRVAFQKIYEKSYRKLLYIAQGIIHNVHDAEEIVHDIYAKMADEFPYYSRFTVNQVIGIGVVMTRNACINKIRFRQKYPESSFEDEKEFIDDGKNMLEDIVNEESIKELASAYRRLDQKDRDILALYYGYKMSYKEIGKTMEMSTKTVDMRLYRAKSRLKKEMKNKI